MKKSFIRADKLSIGSKISFQGEIVKIIEILETPEYIKFCIQFPSGKMENLQVPLNVKLAVYEDYYNEDGFKTDFKEKYAFICSPFAGDTERNIAYAIECCKEAIKRGYTPIAPHLYFPQFLDDNNPEQREKGLILGREAMKEKCDIVFIGDKYGISDGMKGDLEFANEMGVPVECLNTLNGFNKSEVIMAIRFVLGVINGQGYKLDVYEYPEPGTDILRFNLLDKKGNCLYECDNLYQIVSFVQSNAKNRINSEFLFFMNNNPVIKKILSVITAPVYTDYVATGFGEKKNIIEEEIEV